MREMYTPQIPLLCRKTGVCRGISIFHIFGPKHRLWVLVTENHLGEPIYDLSKIIIHIIFSNYMFIFYCLKKSLYIARAFFRNANIFLIIYI